MTATILLCIENTYSDGEEITTHSTISVPLPPEDPDDRDVWADEWIWPETGTGHTGGDAYYTVEIMESTAPEMVGMTFEWG